MNLRAESDAYRQSMENLFMETPALINIVRGPEHRYDFINPPAQELMGPGAMLGGRARDHLPEMEGSGAAGLGMTCSRRRWWLANTRDEAVQVNVGLNDDGGLVNLANQLCLTRRGAPSRESP